MQVGEIRKWDGKWVDVRKGPEDLGWIWVRKWAFPFPLGGSCA